MAKTKTAAAMDELQSHIRPFFEQRGYRLRARTFNRGTSDGLVHVLNFQMGQTSLQGKFTVNVGVYVPEVARVEYGPNERSFVQEPECCVRHRLGTLGPEHRDLWWDLLPNGPSAANLQLRLERDALPFLARFETRDSVFQELARLKGNSGLGMPPRLVCAILLVHRGQDAKAKETLAAQIREAMNKGHKGHADYVQRLAEHLGLGSIPS
jgi:hypothetical protein